MYKCTVSGSAVLEDGTRIPYVEYVGDKSHRPHPYWQKVRMARYEADGHKCVLCKRELDEHSFQTHHMSYERLGHERLRDVITLCNECHERFHENVEAWRVLQRAGRRPLGDIFTSGNGETMRGISA